MNRKSYKGKNNPSYLDGRTLNKNKKYYCKEQGCNKEICFQTYYYGEGHCKSCAQKGSRNNKWIENINKFPKCLDCGKYISRNSKYCDVCKSKGDKNGNYKDGKSGLISFIRRLQENKEWRKAIFERDNYTCQFCHKRGGNLHAHHSIKIRNIIKNFKITNVEEAKNCSFLWNINNGITLCEKHHNLIEHNPSLMKKTKVLSSQPEESVIHLPFYFESGFNEILKNVEEAPESDKKRE